MWRSFAIGCAIASATLLTGAPGTRSATNFSVHSRDGFERKVSISISVSTPTLATRLFGSAKRGSSAMSGRPIDSQNFFQNCWPVGETAMNFPSAQG